MFGVLNKLGVLGALASTVVCLGCCVSVLGPLAGVLLAGGFLDRVPVDWQIPLLYGSLALAFAGFGLGWRKHRRLCPTLLFVLGGAAILYPLHEALDVWALQLLIWLGFGLLLAAAAWDTGLSVRVRPGRLPLARLEGSGR